MGFFNKANAIFLVIFFGGVFCSTSYYLYEKNRIREQSIERFNAISEKRYTNILNMLRNKKDVMNFIHAFFNASEFVSESDFKLFTKDLLSKFNLINIFWDDPNTSTQYIQMEQGSQDYSSMFSFIERAKVFDDEKPKLIFSRFCPSKGGKQKGFINIVFTLSSLMHKDESDFLDERLILNDANNNVFLSYKYQASRIVLDSVPLKIHDEIYRYFEIDKFHDVNFLYLSSLHHDKEYKDRQHYLLAIFSLFLFISLILSLYTRKILRQKEEIEKIVNIRTEELSQFAYRASHDLKAPLSTIKSLAHYIDVDIQAGSYKEARRNIMKVSSQSEKLGNLVTDILNLAKADIEGKVIEKVDLIKILEDFELKYAGLIKEKRIEIDYEVELPAPLYSEKIRMIQILENLISNSIKYSDPEKDKKFVSIKAYNTNHATHILIEDNGLGFPPESRNSVFKVFQRFHPQVKDGSGFGLTIVKKHIDQLGGKIFLRDSLEGVLFEIILPRR